jgi:hypothetical protein
MSKINITKNIQIYKGFNFNCAVNRFTALSQLYFSLGIFNIIIILNYAVDIAKVGRLYEHFSHFIIVGDLKLIILILRHTKPPHLVLV